MSTEFLKAERDRSPMSVKVANHATEGVYFPSEFLVLGPNFEGKTREAD